MQATDIYFWLKMKEQNEPNLSMVLSGTSGNLLPLGTRRTTGATESTTSKQTMNPTELCVPCGFFGTGLRKNWQETVLFPSFEHEHLGIP